MPAPDPIHLLIPTALCFTSLGYVGSTFATAMGVGSSIVFLPMLLWLLPHLGVGLANLAPTAVGTSLAASSVVMLSGTYAHWRAGNLRDSSAFVGWLLLAAAAGGLVGGAFVLTSPALVLMFIVAGGQILIAAVLLTRLARPAAASLATGTSAVPGGSTPASAALTDASSRTYVLMVGFLTAVGAGGVFLSPYFLWRGLSRSRAAALACAVGVAIATTSTLLFTLSAVRAQAGLIHAPAACALALGAILGGRQGVRLAASIGPSAWTTALVVTLVVSAARSVARVL